jgi:hypothetical protein
MADTLNADGLLMRFGTAQSRRTSRTAVTTDTTKRNELVAKFTLTGAARTIYPGDGGLSRFTGLDTPIPAGSRIQSVEVLTIQTPAGGSGYSISTFNVDGSTQSAGGLATVSSGNVVTNGALVGTQTTQDAYVSITTTGTYTAGIVEVIINYVIQ